MSQETWTGERVIRHLAEAFSNIQGIAICAPHNDRDEFDVGPIDGLWLIADTARALGQRSKIRYFLLSYARASRIAHKRIESFDPEREALAIAASEIVAAWLDRKDRQNAHPGIYDSNPQADTQEHTTTAFSPRASP